MPLSSQIPIQVKKKACIGGAYLIEPRNDIFSLIHSV